MAWQGNGIGTACYVWISLKKKQNTGSWSTSTEVDMILNIHSWWEPSVYSYRPRFGVPHHFFRHRPADIASFLSVHHVLHCRICSRCICVSVPRVPPLEETQGSYRRNSFSYVPHCVVSSTVACKFIYLSGVIVVTVMTGLLFTSERSHYFRKPYLEERGLTSTKS